MSKNTDELFDALEAERSKISDAKSPQGAESRISKDENPIDISDAGFKEAGAYSGDYHGAFSLEKFASSSSLSYTHEDAQGFLDYLKKFYPANFWYKDKYVRIWAYYEQYDNWQDTYGMDAVMASYHSGHGGMTSDGRFWVPLGQDWGGLGTNAWSNQMKLGNEQTRYIFWSTCVSLRVTGGHSPIRTWGSQPNPGFRMIFGYDSNSVDNKNYGKYFWQQWNKKKSFSTAFMDASWQISTNQRPSVAACGTNKEEAKNRVYKERFLNWGKVSHNWWWWRWYSKSSAHVATRPVLTQLPPDIVIPHLAPPIDASIQFRTLQSKFNLSVSGQPLTGSNGDVFAGNEQQHLSVSPDGSYEVKFADANLENTVQIPTEIAVDRGFAFIRQYGLGTENLKLDSVGLSMSAGGTDQGSGERMQPTVSETILKFVQNVEDIPIVSNETFGSVIIRIDNDGTVTSISNAQVEIEDLRSHESAMPPTPGEDRKQPEMDPKQAINKAWQEHLKDWIVKGTMPQAYNVLPGTFEVGYALSGQEAYPVARQEVEADCGGGIIKRFVLEAPLLG